MINDIVTAIAARLAELFGADTVIHMNEVPQGPSVPCFFILPLTMTQQHIAGDRYFRKHGFDVAYFPEPGGAAELNNVTDRLWMGLEYIELADGTARGTEMRREVQDGALHFFVNYDCFVLKVRDREPVMQTLIQNQEIKE